MNAGDIGPNQMAALRQVAEQLRRASSGPPDSEYSSARDYSVRAMGMSNSVISSAIKYPETITQSLLDKLEKRDPERFRNVSARVMLARVKDISPELLDRSGISDVQRAQMLNTIELMQEALQEMKLKLDEQ